MRKSLDLETILWYGLAILVLLEKGVYGHGRLIEPPSRASAWRYGFDTPHNYNDHELYCGGFTRQWNKNGGKCGVCGDAWDSPKPRAHELGGRFGQGVIVRKYAPKDVIVIKVELTASHNGFFEFRVCDKLKDTDQECMDKHVLNLEGKSDTRYYPREGNKIYEMKYQLPEGLECTHCVLQWKYIAGNNWGTCANGTGAVGCGPQEEFRACADIAIGDRFTTTTRRPRPTYVPPNRTPKVPTPEQSESSGSAWFGVIIAIITLFIAIAVLAGIYLYYYRGGMRIKNLLKSKGAPPAPVPPPRHKRSSLSRENPPEISSPKGISESGFETVDLRSK
ncbi:putative eukaryotic translation initiation factor 3 theta subunit [Danaus plexippus plexippus]|uniref:Eukaryotic translation initiation factor 3 theta subunit n=1 Tax=Danaus plexippus plexippus TaxID=278856 RepID=A0A212FMQ8_DANPL|nr:putative eukaryotic translation initiation factor 3 theta subunit [Danaus plexippus plexippus]